MSALRASLRLLKEADSLPNLCFARGMTHIRLRLLVSGIAIAAILARYLFKVSIDPTAVGLLCLVLLPWLAPLIKSVEIPGVGKIELQELKEKAEEATGAAQSASQKAELALASAGSEIVGARKDAVALDTASSSFDECAAEYNRLRADMPSGPMRTSLMAKIVSRMIKIVPLLTGYDVDAALRQSNGGKRLGAYAFLYARPDLKFLDALVSSVTSTEDTAFGQYWGILSIQRVAGVQAGQPIPAATFAKLSAFSQKLQRGTDRYYELTKVLQLSSGK